MIKTSFLLLLSLLTLTASAQFYSITEEDFSNLDNIVDLSELLLWGDNTTVVSAFETGNKTDNQGVTKKAIYLSQEAISMGGYNAGSTYTSTAFDILFDTLSHRSDTICIEWDYLSEMLSGNGESGRLGIALMRNYPENLPQFNDVYNQSDIAPFGRPAYNLRLLNGTDENKQAYLFYGGGKDEEGEFEKLGDGTWLPGFISGPGGISPGSIADYPQGPVKIANVNTVSATNWHHYTWFIYPEKMEVYWRNSSADSSFNELIMSMSIPFAYKPETDIITELNAYHNTSVSELPALYNWFDSIQGVRFYFRSIQNGYLANIEVSTTKYQQSISVPEAPVITPLAGTYFDSVEVSIHAGSEALIYYTLDGTDPTTESAVYTDPFWIYTDTQLKAVTWNNGLFSDSITELNYLIENSVNVPLISRNIDIKIFPNPFTEMINIVSENQWNDIHVRIIDVSGRVVSVIKEGKGNNLTYPAYSLMPGMYYVEIIIDHEIKKSFMINKNE